MTTREKAEEITNSVRSWTIGEANAKTLTNRIEQALTEAKLEVAGMMQEKAAEIVDEGGRLGLYEEDIAKAIRSLNPSEVGK